MHTSPGDVEVDGIDARRVVRRNDRFLQADRIVTPLVSIEPFDVVGRIAVDDAAVVVVGRGGDDKIIGYIGNGYGNRLIVAQCPVTRSSLKYALVSTG